MSAVRTRGSLFQTVGLFKALDERISVNEVLAFLCVCESEGLTVQELADLAGLTQSTASRSVRALGPAASPWSQPPALGLVEAFLHPNDGRSHVIYLTAHGRDVRARLEALVREAPAFAPERPAFAAVRADAA